MSAMPELFKAVAESAPVFGWACQGVGMSDRFREAILADGMAPPDFIKPDSWCRFPGIGKPKSNKAGYCRLFPDGRAGIYGDFASGFQRIWQADKDRQLTPAEKAAFAKELKEHQRKHDETLKMRHKEKAEEAERIMASANGGDPKQHAYWLKKGVDLGLGVKRGAWPKKNWEDALLFPIYGEDGRLSTIQAVNNDGQKDFLAGAKKQGCFYPGWGRIRGASQILVGEGAASCGAAYVSTGKVVVSGLDAGNLIHVVRALRHINPNASIFLVADNDIKPNEENIGLKAAKNAAEAVGGGVVVPEMDGRKVDAWDFFNERGPEALKLLINDGIAKANQNPDPPPGQTNSSQTKPERPPILTFTRGKDLILKRAPIRWLIKNVIEQNSINSLFGQYASMKSFIVIDMAFCVAAGIPWHGHEVRQMPVAIICGEGHSGISGRLAALALKYDIAFPDDLLISDQSASLALPEVAFEVGEIINAIFPGEAFVVIDTLGRNFGKNENSTEDMTQYMGNLDRIFRYAGKTVTSVHHTGHAQNDRARGSIVLAASCEGEHQIIRSADNFITLKCLKQKNAQEYESIVFQPETKDVGWLDEDGEPVTSLVLNRVEPGSGCLKDHSKTKKMTKRESLVLESLYRAIRANGVEPCSEIKERFGGFTALKDQSRKVAHLNDWRSEAYPVIDAEGDNQSKQKEAKKKAFQRARDNLFALGKVANFDDHWWPTFNDV
jgi:phage/plasmid primase-like uncharacterized protein